MDKGFIAGFITALVLVLGIKIYLFVDPFKVTHPADPRFNPDKFKFKDYGGRDERRKIYRELFPVGTDRGFVDRMFVLGGNAKIYYPGNSRLTYYHVPTYEHHKGVWLWEGSHTNYMAIFDENNKLLNLKSAGDYDYLYPDQITKEDLSTPNSSLNE